MPLFKIKNRDETLALLVQKLPDCSSEEEKKKSLHSIQKLYAYQLFDGGHYDKSMKEFLKLNTDPAEVIELFPDLSKGEGCKNKKLKGKALVEADNALIEYLGTLRSQIRQTKSEASLNTSQEQGSQKNEQQQLEVIDTTLLKCYLQLQKNDLVEPLLRLNTCRLEDAEKALLQHKKYNELIILFETKAEHDKALQLMRQLSNQRDLSFKGCNRTRNYLQTLGAEHMNIIFKFSDWVLKENPEEGLKIFTEDIVRHKDWSRLEIYLFLKNEHYNLAIPYLEHLIITWNETDSLFHDVLISMYREKITQKKADITEKEYQHTKSKLIKFLEKCPYYYTPEKVIQHFPTDDLFEERAVIVGKLGRHEQVLAIYVQILGDVDRAQKYCEKVSDVDRDIYFKLIRILLSPDNSAAFSGPLPDVPKGPANSLPDLKTALSILELHADEISPLKALSVLPDSVPLSQLKHFLEGALESQLELKRRTQVLKGLLYSEYLQARELKKQHESKNFVISDYHLCPVCKKRFTKQSAFVRFPNGDILHYSCTYRVDKF